MNPLTSPSTCNCGTVFVAHQGHTVTCSNTIRSTGFVGPDSCKLSTLHAPDQTRLSRLLKSEITIRIILAHRINRAPLAHKIEIHSPATKFSRCARDMTNMTTLSITLTLRLGVDAFCQLLLLSSHLLWMKNLAKYC